MQLDNDFATEVKNDDPSKFHNSQKERYTIDILLNRYIYYLSNYNKCILFRKNLT